LFFKRHVDIGDGIGEFSVFFKVDLSIYKKSFCNFGNIFNIKSHVKAGNMCGHAMRGDFPSVEIIGIHRKEPQVILFDDRGLDYTVIGRSELRQMLHMSSDDLREQPVVKRALLIGIDLVEEKNITASFYGRDIGRFIKMIPPVFGRAYLPPELG